MDKNYLVIDNETGKVRNIVVWDGVSPYAPENATLIDLESAPHGVGFGCKKENNKWFKSEYNRETGEEIWTEIK